MEREKDEDPATSVELEFDPKVHVTAGELRKLYGWDLGTIPDFAFIRRGAWTAVDCTTEYDESTKKLHGSMSVVFTEPFHWWKMEVVVEEGKGDS